MYILPNEVPSKLKINIELNRALPLKEIEHQRALVRQGHVGVHAAEGFLHDGVRDERAARAGGHQAHAGKVQGRVGALAVRALRGQGDGR